MKRLMQAWWVVETAVCCLCIVFLFFNARHHAYRTASVDAILALIWFFAAHFTWEKERKK